MILGSACTLDMATVTTTRLLFLCWIQLAALDYGVSGLPDLNLTKLSKHAVLGQPFTLQCVLNADGIIGVLIFKHNNFPKCSVTRDTCTQYTPANTTMYSCECTPNNGSIVTYKLDIKEVRNETVGPWVCEYQKKSNVVNIKLTDPEGPNSVTLDTPSVVTPTEYQAVNVTCAAQCIPECQFSWTLDNMDVSSHTDGQTLVLESVKPDQGGQYTCTAVNPTSGMTGNASLQMTVLRAPRLDTSYPFSQKVYTDIGNTVNLTAHFLAVPAPLFTWWKIVGGTLTPIQTRGVKDKERRQQVEPGDFGPQSVSTMLEVVVDDEEDLGMYCVTAGNEVNTTSVYLELDTPEVPTDTDWLGVGVGIGAGVMLAIALLVAGLVYRKYSIMKRDLEHPYAKTEPRSPQGENDYQSTLENHYQELPTPNLDRKKILLNLEDKRPKSDIYHVCDKDKEIRRDGGCNSIVIGKSMLNPAYGGFSCNPYEIPVTTK